MNIIRSWPMHNIVAHPIMEILSWFGANRLALRVHNATLPVEAAEEPVAPIDRSGEGD